MITSRGLSAPLEVYRWVEVVGKRLGRLTMLKHRKLSAL